MEINIKSLTKWYGKKIRAIHNITFDIKEGAIFGLLGPSGSGKTTLIKVLSGLIKDFKGQVMINGIRLPSRKTSSLIGYMPQTYALYMELSVKENLDFFASINGMHSKKERYYRIDELLGILQLTDKKNTPVEELSGGMKQRVSLGSALIHKPKLLLLDEPTIGLDPRLRLQFWDYFKKLAGEGTTILVTTHIFGEAKSCSHIAFLKLGELIACDELDHILKEADSKDLEEAFLFYMEKEATKDRRIISK
jgi:ABC-2 type transport system ATP-binding protein